MKMNISLPVEIDIPDCAIKEIRNNAIDDFYRKIVMAYSEMNNIPTVEKETAKTIALGIAEQLKGGGVNE